MYVCYLNLFSLLLSCEGLVGVFLQREDFRQNLPEHKMKNYLKNVYILLKRNFYFSHSRYRRRLAK
jgi:hypothetical protein